MQRYGINRQGKQRWHCRQCARTFVWRNPANRYQQRRVWFERWIMEGYTVRQLAAQSGYSPRTLHRIIAHWLQQAPPLASELSAARHLILDGTFLDRRKGVFAVMDAARFAVVYAAPEMAEGPVHLQPFCATLAHYGVTPLSATVDGNLHLIRILRQVWPTIVIQRCLVHIQRQGLSWCRQMPKRPDARHLRTLFRHVMAIHTMAERDHFVAQVQAWEYRYGQRLAGQAERGRVFSDLKRARSMLLAALPNMFHYLDDPVIPKSTNALEGYFARLKHKYRQHRGLVRPHRNAYLQWYVYLCPR